MVSKSRAGPGVGTATDDGLMPQGAGRILFFFVPPSYLSHINYIHLVMQPRGAGDGMRRRVGNDSRLSTGGNSRPAD